MSDSKGFVLFESAAGYGLFEKIIGEDVGEQTPEYQQSIADFSKFNKLFKLKAFIPYSTPEEALENANSLSEGVVTSLLKGFLANNLKAGTKSVIEVAEKDLASAISEIGYKSKSTTQVLEYFRGIRTHFSSFVKDLKPGDVEKAQLGLAHSYSRSKVKFNVNRVDNMIIQSISLLDQMDKDLNTFAMRCREWYSWHFPELARIVTNNIQFAKLAKLIQNKKNLSESDIPALAKVVDEDVANDILRASQASMGTDISEIDLVNIMTFADRVIDLAAYREKLHDYLGKKMNDVAPNLAALIGEQVGARLVAGAGSLVNLAKMPASTIQVLGAEKALFRALKAKTNTPKYGMIFNASAVGKASQKNKGRISRYLSNKCSVAARIDSFSENPTRLYGEKLKSQVDERLEFYNSGAVPTKNQDAMKEVAALIQSEEKASRGKKRSSKDDETKSSKTPSKKSKKAESDSEEEKPAKSKKSKKVESDSEEEKPTKSKKSKKVESDSEEEKPTKSSKTPSKKSKKAESDSEEEKPTKSSKTPSKTPSKKSKKVESESESEEEKPTKSQKKRK